MLFAKAVLLFIYLLTFGITMYAVVKHFWHPVPTLFECIHYHQELSDPSHLYYSGRLRTFRRYTEVCRNIAIIRGRRKIVYGN